MRATRVAPAAAHALQVTLVVIFVLLPLFVPVWAIISFVLVPTAARGLRNTDSTPSGRMPESLAFLNVANADIGDQGATALAAALLESGAVCQVVSCLNHIGLAGQAALLQVLEAKHGASLAGYISVAFAQAPALFPPFLQRAVACGVRYNWETRGVLYYL